MIIYDFDNEAVEVKLPKKQIVSINVSVISGDETGNVVFEDGEIVSFDASNCRMIGFFDGSYSVVGEDIQKWLNYKPSKKGTASYERQELFSESYVMCED